MSADIGGGRSGFASSQAPSHSRPTISGSRSADSQAASTGFHLLSPLLERPGESSLVLSVHVVFPREGEALPDSLSNGQWSEGPRWAVLLTTPVPEGS